MEESFEGFLQIEMGSSFYINAGILGLIKMLEYSKAEKDIDYKIQNQNIYLSEKFIREQDLAHLYVKTLVKRLGKDTKYNYILDKQDIVTALYEKENMNEDDKDKIHDIYKEFVGMLEKNSFKAGYVILQTVYNNDLITIEKISEFKKEKDELKKKELYFELCEALDDITVKEVLIMKELMYSKIKLFYEGTSFFLPANLKKSIVECYRKDFVKPILKELDAKKTGKKRCIECSNLVNEVKSISFMLDSTDDTARKKSHYWNQKVDAFVCPICAFLYTLVPLGVEFCGADAVFINVNSSVKDLEKIMNSYKQKIKDSEQDNKVSDKSKFFRIFTTDGITMLKEGTNSIQVVVRMSNKEHFDMEIISTDILKGLTTELAKTSLEYLESKYIKLNDSLNKKYLSVYDEVMKNILLRRSQYHLINKLINYGLREGKGIGYIKNILYLQVIFKGGNQMEILKINVNKAYAEGKKMRNFLTDGISEEKKDENLRGIVYKLNNMISVKNREQFIDNIIRIYAGKGIAIPDIFKECYESDEALQAIGHAFILGLKALKEKDSKNVNNENEKNKDEETGN